jgi:hypothetical protein
MAIAAEPQANMVKNITDLIAAGGENWLPVVNTGHQSRN